MRRLLVPACLAVLYLAPPSGAVAEDGGGCDMLCRLAGYLTSDHMAAGPAGAEAPAAGNPKPRHPRVAAAKPAKIAGKTAAGPAKPVQASAPAVASAGKAVPAAGKAAAASHPAMVKAAEQKPAVVAATAKPIRSASHAKLHGAPSKLAAAEPAIDKERPSTDTAPAAIRRPRAAKATAVARAPRVAALAEQPRAQTAAAIIPGSAPTMPAGFQPVGSVSFH